MLHHTDELIMNFQYLVFALGNMSYVVLAVVECCLNQHSLAVFMDHFKVVGQIMDMSKQLFNSEYNKSLILPIEVLPKYEIT